MDKRPPLRKRGSSLFNKMTTQDVSTGDRDSHFSTISTKIKTHRMRKTSQLSLSLGPLDEHEVRPSSQRRGSPHLHRIHSVPDLLARSQASVSEPRAFLNGKPISNPFNFRHVSHMENQQTAQLDYTTEDALPDQWNTIVRESRAPKTPIVPLTPLSPRGVRHIQSLSGSLRTAGLNAQSPGDTTYSPVNSIAEISINSKSAESLAYAFPSHLAPPPRASSRAVITSSSSAKDQEVPILESECRDSIVFSSPDIPATSLSPMPQQRGVNPILEEEPSLLDQELEDDVLGAFPTPPIQRSGVRPPSMTVDQKALSELRSYKSQPNIAINNQLLIPPSSPPRPSSSSSETLGLTVSGVVAKEKPFIANKRLSKRISKRQSRRISILADAQAEIQSWEADIDWTYDNNDLDEWVDDLEGIEEEENDSQLIFMSGSRSAPVSASPSTINLASLNTAQTLVNRHSDGSKPLLSACEITPSPRSPGIGIADGGFGIFDHADREYNATGHQRQLSKTRNSTSHSRTLSTCASLPNLKAGRKHYRNPSLRGFSSLDNGVVTLDEADELQNTTFARTHAAPREVAIPPARYSGRSRAASNATCTTLVSDIEGFSSDISEMASTPSHSNHNSAEGPYFFPQTQDGLFIDNKGQLTPNVQIVNEEAPFNFF